MFCKTCKISPRMLEDSMKVTNEMDMELLIELLSELKILGAVSSHIRVLVSPIPGHPGLN